MRNVILLGLLALGACTTAVPAQVQSAVPAVQQACTGAAVATVVAPKLVANNPKIATAVADACAVANGGTLTITVTPQTVTSTVN